MKKGQLFFVAFLFSSTVLFAQEVSTNEFEINRRVGLLPSVKLGMNIFSRASVAQNAPVTSNNKIQFSGGLGADYFFNRYLGTFAQIDFNQRSYNFSNVVVASASYVDVPFGLAINYLVLPWSNSARMTTRLGGYVALPTSNFDFDKKSAQFYNGIQQGVTFISAQDYTGLYIESETLVSISKNLNPGISVWGKIPLGSAIKFQFGDSNFYEFGLGLKVGFF